MPRTPAAPALCLLLGHQWTASITGEWGTHTGFCFPWVSQQPQHNAIQPPHVCTWTCLELCQLQHLVVVIVFVVFLLLLIFRLLALILFFFLFGKGTSNKIIIDRFYIVLFSAFEQTHCACMWFYMSEWLFIALFFLNIHWTGVLKVPAWLVPHETAAISACSVYTIQPCTVSLHAKPHT